VRWTRRLTVMSLLAAVLALSAGLAAALSPVRAGTVPTPHAGVLRYNTPICGREYAPVSLGKGNYFNVYNTQSGNTCISVERHHLSWYVYSFRPTPFGWQYPNISSGWEWGRYTCLDGRSARPGHGSKCMRYPVQVRKDGFPYSTVSAWPHLSNGNLSYDIWFSHTAKTPVLQNNAAEVMIWLALPGISLSNYNIWYYTKIDGQRWAVIHWVASNRTTGTRWNYVAYLAVHQSSHFAGWLNPFFRDAERHGWLSPRDYLTGIDFGEEINRPSTYGRGFAVKYYTLTGVN
jgi:hypothetical protein